MIRALVKVKFVDTEQVINYSNSISQINLIQIKKQAALTAQKPAHQSQPYLTNQVGKLVLSSKPNGESAPNAVIRLNKNNNRNDEVGISFASEVSNKN